MQMRVLYVVVHLKLVQPLAREVELARIEVQVRLSSNILGLLDEDGVRQRNPSSVDGIVVDDPRH